MTTFLPAELQEGRPDHAHPKRGRWLVGGHHVRRQDGMVSRQLRARGGQRQESSRGDDAKVDRIPAAGAAGPIAERRGLCIGAPETGERLCGADAQIRNVSETVPSISEKKREKNRRTILLLSLKESEFRQLFGNLDELTEVHSSMNSDVASAIRGVPNPREQRVGRALLQHGAAVRSAHQTYWANHPKAVCVLERHRDRLNAFMESK